MQLTEADRWLLHVLHQPHPPPSNNEQRIIAEFLKNLDDYTPGDTYRLELPRRQKNEEEEYRKNVGYRSVLLTHSDKREHCLTAVVAQNVPDHRFRDELIRILKTPAARQVGLAPEDTIEVTTPVAGTPSLLEQTGLSLAIYFLTNPYVRQKLFHSYQTLQPCPT